MGTFTKLGEVVSPGGNISKLSLTNIPSNYHAWYIRMVLSNNAGFTSTDTSSMRFNDFGGFGATYRHQSFLFTRSGFRSGANGGDEQFPIWRTTNGGNDAGDWWQFEGYLYRPNGNKASMAWRAGAYQDDDLARIVGTFGNVGLSYNGPITSVQIFTNFLWESGSKIEIYGIE